jgi:hypothetical protein
VGKLLWWMFLFVSIMLAHTVAPQAHDALNKTKWIYGQDKRNPKTNELCCGQNDCFEVPSDQVTQDGTGYWIGRWEHVPFAETSPSPDGVYWRCQDNKDKRRRCFFAPPPSM